MSLPFKPVILWTDALIYLLVFSAITFFIWARRKKHVREAWRQVLKNRLAMVAMVILFFYVAIGLLDSIHYRPALPSTAGSQVTHYAAQAESLFDLIVAPLGKEIEKTYSAPFALYSFVKESTLDQQGQAIRIYPRLRYAGLGIANKTQRFYDIVHRITKGILSAILLWIILLFVFFLRYKKNKRITFIASMKMIITDQTELPLRLLLLTCLVMLMIIAITTFLAAGYHIFGTDKVGQDVFYQTLKSIRTGLVIGTLTTLIMLPFAIFLGIAAGFWGGWIDDAIQYLYTTLSSIPAVLLIAAAILSLQIFIATHATWFHTLDERADVRLLALCIILGITSWTGLCRMLRAETLKLREIDYIQAAQALGSARSKILLRHVLPNVMHIVLIAIVLDFSSLVLAEAVLSYVGVGVAPTTASWGNMINSARLELAREPIVWWPMLAAFIFMFVLVLAANLFADAVRDGFDPRLRG